MFEVYDDIVFFTNILYSKYEFLFHYVIVVWCVKIAIYIHKDPIFEFERISIPIDTTIIFFTFIEW